MKLETSFLSTTAKVQFFTIHVFIIIFAGLFLIGCASSAPELNQEGLLLIKAGKYQKAQHKFSEACLQAPENYELNLNLAQTYILLGEPQKALATVKQALQKKPGLLEGRMMLAQVHFMLGELDEAQEIMSALMKDHPEHAGCHVALGNIAFRKQNWKESIEYYRKAIDLNINSAEVYIQLGEAILFAGKDHTSLQTCFKEAKAAFRNAVYLDRDNLQAYLRLAWLDLQMGNHEESMAEVKQALRLEPDNQEALLMQAFLEIEDQNYIQAIQHLNQLIERNASIKNQVLQAFALNFPRYFNWMVSLLKHPDKRIAEFIAEVLAKISGQPVSFEQKIWEKWWQEEQAKFLKQIKSLKK